MKSAQFFAKIDKKAVFLGKNYYTDWSAIFYELEIDPEFAPTKLDRHSIYSQFCQLLPDSANSSVVKDNFAGWIDSNHPLPLAELILIVAICLQNLAGERVKHKRLIAEPDDRCWQLFCGYENPESADLAMRIGISYAIAVVATGEEAALLMSKLQAGIGNYLSRSSGQILEQKTIAFEGIDNTLDALVKKSQQTIEKILDDPSLPAQEKADTALKILQIAANRNCPPKPKQNFSTESKAADENEYYFLAADYFQLDNFLDDKEHQQVLNLALNKRAEFAESGVVDSTDNHRRSYVIDSPASFPDLYHSVKEKIIDLLPLVFERLDYPQFDLAEIEMQMTAHNDGCFYKIHPDVGSPDTQTRELTYVYYFYQEPKQFAGGNLKIYDTEIRRSGIDENGSSQIVEPRNNSIVFFNSRCLHEVLPIKCPSQSFEHSRFTLNGWLRV